MFEKATKEKRKARVELQGLSGSGKTYTALSFATTFAGEKGKVAVIDTEHGRSKLYSEIFDFDVVELHDFAPARYIEAITAAARAGYGALVIDSLSHAWVGQGGVLDIAGGVFSGWKKATPEHNRLVEAILTAPLHVVTTCRMKTGYQVDKNPQTGKQEVSRLGLEVIQRNGIEYEFDWVLEMDLEHQGKVIKTPLPDIDGMVFSKPGAEVAEGILNFLGNGVDPKPQPEPVASAPQNTKKLQ